MLVECLLPYLSVSVHLFFKPFAGYVSKMISLVPYVFLKVHLQIVILI